MKYHESRRNLNGRDLDNDPRSRSLSISWLWAWPSIRTRSTLYPHESDYHHHPPSSSTSSKNIGIGDDDEAMNIDRRLTHKRSSISFKRRRRKEGLFAAIIPAGADVTVVLILWLSYSIVEGMADEEIKMKIVYIRNAVPGFLSSSKGSWNIKGQIQ